jgi:uncharacterized protein YijF (DUF1287 family)
MWTRRAAMVGLAVVGGCTARPPAPIAGPPEAGDALAAAARAQIGVTTGYDGSYRLLSYPGGDPPRGTGACSDVLVRAARDAWGVDLQQRVHEDMLANFSAYPHRWGLKAPNSNIDHRRVPNLETYLTRQGACLWRAAIAVWGMGFPGVFETGDILTWRCAGSNGPHVAIVVQGGDGPRIVENKGGGVREVPLSANWEDGAQAHFRWRVRIPPIPTPRP